MRIMKNTVILIQLIRINKKLKVKINRLHINMKEFCMSSRETPRRVKYPGMKFMREEGRTNSMQMGKVKDCTMEI